MLCEAVGKIANLLEAIEQNHHGLANAKTTTTINAANEDHGHY